MYYSTPSNTTSSFAATDEVHYHLPYVCRLEILPVNICANWSWKHPRTRPMRGGNQPCFCAKNQHRLEHIFIKNPDTRGAAPSLLIILVNLCITARNFARFLTTAGQLPSAAEITSPNYLKEVTISRGHTYTLKALAMTSLSSSASRQSRFLPTPFLHYTVR